MAALARPRYSEVAASAARLLETLEGLKLVVTRVRNVNPVQFGLVYGVILAVIMFVFALLMLPFGAMLASLGRANIFGFGSFAMVIIAPIFYFCVGFVGGFITAAVYNFVAQWTGGVEVTLSTATADVPHASGVPG